MIKEAYVSFDVAKLLKEKGFNEYCSAFYTHDKELNKGKTLTNAAIDDGITYCDVSAPTHQMAMAWLREEYNIILDICPNLDLDCECIGTYCRIIYKDNKRVPLGVDYDDFATYEQAVEAALKYSLENLI